MKQNIYIIILSILLTSCDSSNKNHNSELITLLEKHPSIEYLEMNLDILKVNKKFYCNLIETEIKCLNSGQVKDEFGCTQEELDKTFELVKKSGAFAVEKNDKGQVLFAKGDFMNNFSGLMYSSTEIDLTNRENYFTMFYISKIEKEDDNWYRVE